MNELVIQNYLLFAICWFGALCLLCVSLLWIFYVPSAQSKSAQQKNLDAESERKRRQKFSDGANVAETQSASMLKINSPALRGAHFSSASVTLAPVQTASPSLHILRAEQLANREKNNSENNFIQKPLFDFNQAEINPLVHSQEEQVISLEEKNGSSISHTDLQMTAASSEFETEKAETKNKIDLSTLSGEDIERTQLDLAQALSETGRIAFANSILKELLANVSDPHLKLEAEHLLNSLSAKMT